MAEFTRPKTAPVKMKVSINNNGCIAQIGDQIKSSKYFTIAGISSNASLDEANIIFNTFIGESLGGGDFDSLSAIRTITEGVE